MTQAAFALRGNIIYSVSPRELACLPGGYLVVDHGRVAGAFAALPERWQGLAVQDWGEALLLPGMVDLHVHAPQYAFRGLGMDLPLLPWLNKYTFPEEARYADEAYAHVAYSAFADALRSGFLTRAVVFATIHSAATLRLARLLEQSGLIAYVGRVSMDRCDVAALAEGESALADERAWLAELAAAGLRRVRPVITPRFVPACSPERGGRRGRGRAGRGGGGGGAVLGKPPAGGVFWGIQPRFFYGRRPVITPRFVPACSPELLAGLGRLAAESGLPVQSHLSENRDEVALVAEMYPQSACYGAVYDSFGLLGQTTTVMAHCVHCPPRELDLLQQNGVFIAHCPQSNINLTSGVAPVREMLARGMRVGLGSDVAGGAHLSPLRGIQDAIAASKLRAALLETGEKPLSFAEAFYLATLGGGAFFGSVGSFLPGCAADILVLDDSRSRLPEHDLFERLQRAVYFLDERALQAKYVEGQAVYRAPGAAHS